MTLRDINLEQILQMVGGGRVIQAKNEDDYHDCVKEFQSSPN